LPLADEEGVHLTIVRLGLATSGRHRRRLVGGAVVTGLVAAGVLGIVLVGVGGGSSLVGRIALLAVLAVLVGLAAMLLRAGRAPDGWVEIGDDHVTIIHPELLRSVIVLPRSAVRTILVDASAPDRSVGAAPELAA